MKPEEAIDDIRKCIQPSAGGKSLDLAIQALEKQVPKKVDGEYDEKTCTVCDEDILSYYANYCENCGQKLDWEETP